MLRTVVLALTPSPSPKGRGEPEKLSKSLSPGRGLKAFGIHEKSEGNSGFQVRRGLELILVTLHVHVLRYLHAVTRYSTIFLPQIGLF